MVCPKCGSSNVNVQAMWKPKGRHGCVYWVLIGWWLHPILWIFFTLPMLVWRIIRPNKKGKTASMAVCQDCGHTWKV